MSQHDSHSEAHNWRTLLAYLEGHLPEPERNALEARLTNDAWDVDALEALERYAEQYGFDQARIDAADFENRFNSKIAALAEEAEPARAGMPWARMAAAIALLIAMGGIGWYFMGADGFEPYVFEEYRSAAEQPTTGYEKGMLAYAAGNYTEAIAVLETLPESDAKYEKVLFALANAYAATGQTDQAIAAFQQVLAQPDWTLYRNAAEQSLAQLVH